MKMKILIDATAMGREMSGLTRYIRCVTGGLLDRCAGDVSFTVLVREGEYPDGTVESFHEAGACVEVVDIPPIGFIRDLKLSYYLWRRRKRFDNVYFPSNQYPSFFRGGVYTVHDLIYERYPSQLGRWRGLKRQYLRFNVRRGLKRSSSVVAVSEYTKGEILHFHNIRGLEQKITVTGEGWQHLINIAPASTIANPTISPAPAASPVPAPVHATLAPTAPSSSCTGSPSPIPSASTPAVTVAHPPVPVYPATSVTPISTPATPPATPVAPFLRAVPESGTQELSLPFENYFFFLGSSRGHKNLGRLLEAFELVSKDSGYGLVISGDPEGLTKDQRSSISRINGRRERQGPAVVVTGRLDDRSMAYYFSNASAFVFPSLSEGFGLPVLEAFYFGVPLLCSGNTVFPEVAGDAALYFDPSDTGSIAVAMRYFTDNRDALSPAMIRDGKNRLGRYSWSEAAEKIWQLLQGPV